MRVSLRRHNVLRETGRVSDRSLKREVVERSACLEPDLRGDRKLSSQPAVGNRLETLNSSERCDLLWKVPLNACRSKKY
jgi:hypothetical protein